MSSCEISVVAVWIDQHGKGINSLWCNSPKSKYAQKKKNLVVLEIATRLLSCQNETILGRGRGGGGCGFGVFVGNGTKPLPGNQSSKISLSQLRVYMYVYIYMCVCVCVCVCVCMYVTLNHDSSFNGSRIFLSLFSFASGARAPAPSVNRLCSSGPFEKDLPTIGWSYWYIAYVPRHCLVYVPAVDCSKFSKPEIVFNISLYLSEIFCSSSKSHPQIK